MKTKKLHKSFFFYLALTVFLSVGINAPARGDEYERFQHLRVNESACK